MANYWFYSTPRLSVPILARELRGEWLDLIELGGRVSGRFFARRVMDARLP